MHSWQIPVAEVFNRPLRPQEGSDRVRERAKCRQTVPYGQPSLQTFGQTHITKFTQPFMYTLYKLSRDEHIIYNYVREVAIKKAVIFLN